MSDQNFVAGLLAKLGIKSEDAKKAVEILSDSELSKASSEAIAKTPPHSQTLTSAQHVADRWNEGQMHKVPAPDTLKIGPTQESSGGGAEKMVSEYSNPAGQRGVQVEAERLSAELGSLRGYAKAIATSHNELVDVVKSTSDQVRNLTTVTAAILSKAEDDEKKKKKDEEEEEHGDKACSLFAKGKKLLKKAKKIKVEAKTETVEEKAKSLKKAAKLMRKAAARSIHNAQVEALAGRGVNIDYTFETRKSIAAFISENPSLKADLKLLHEGLDKGEGEAKKARKIYKKTHEAMASSDDSAAKAVQGHSDSKGNQADKKDDKTGNQDDSAVKAQQELESKVTEMSKQVNDALTGFGMLKTNVQGLMDAITARPTTPPLSTVVPLLKSVGDTNIMAIAKKIDEADEAGMDSTHILKARDLLTKYDAVQKGSIHEGIYRNALATAPTAVKELFNAA